MIKRLSILHPEKRDGDIMKSYINDVNEIVTG